MRVGAGVLGNWHAVKQEGRQAESHTNGRASMKESTGVHRISEENSGQWQATGRDSSSLIGMTKVTGTQSATPTRSGTATRLSGKKPLASSVSEKITRKRDKRQETKQVLK